MAENSTLIEKLQKMSNQDISQSLVYLKQTLASMEATDEHWHGNRNFCKMEDEEFRIFIKHNTAMQGIRDEIKTIENFMEEKNRHLELIIGGDEHGSQPRGNKEGVASS